MHLCICICIYLYLIYTYMLYTFFSFFLKKFDSCPGPQVGNKAIISNNFSP